MNADKIVRSQNKNSTGNGFVLLVVAMVKHTTRGKYKDDYFVAISITHALQWKKCRMSETSPWNPHDQ